MFGTRAASPESSRMHCVTSLKTVRANPGAINTEAHVWANTRQPAARIQSLERSDTSFLVPNSRRERPASEVTSVTLVGTPGGLGGHKSERPSNPTLTCYLAIKSIVSVSLNLNLTGIL